MRTLTTILLVILISITFSYAIIHTIPSMLNTPVTAQHDDNDRHYVEAKIIGNVRSYVNHNGARSNYVARHKGDTLNTLDSMFGK